MKSLILILIPLVLFAMGVVIQFDLLKRKKRGPTMANNALTAQSSPPYYTYTSTAGNTSNLTFQQPSYSVSGTSTLPQWATLQPHITYSNGNTFAYPSTAYPVNNVFPFDVYKLSTEELNMIADFKKRNPDFDDYETEMNLIMEQFPNMKDSTLYLALFYDLAKKIRAMIRDYVVEEKNKNEETSSEL